MRLIVRLRPSDRSQLLLKECEAGGSAEAFQQYEEENRKHVLECAKVVRSEIPSDAVLEPLPRFRALVVECPAGKEYRLRENIQAACRYVESFGNDFEMHIIDGSPMYSRD